MGLKVTEMVRIQARLPSGSYCLNKEKKNQTAQSDSSWTENLSEV